MKAPIAAAVLFAISAIHASSAHAGNLVRAWIQLGPGSSAEALGMRSYGDRPETATPTILARAIVDDVAEGCPSLTVDGSLTIEMTQRFNGGQMTKMPGSKRYPNEEKAGYPDYFVRAGAMRPGTFPDGTAKATTAWGLCEAVVPPGHRAARIGTETLKLPAANPKRIVLIGDTGCRMAGIAQQKCHDPEDFPFAAIARRAAAAQPDLIVHVGDYFYRDTDCAVPVAGAYVSGCDNPESTAYEPWGDTFDSWNADLFYPGAPLLAAAPWVMTRGNHESCGRGARGWFALLDPHPFDPRNAMCAGGAGGAPAGEGGPVFSADYAPAYAVAAGAVNFLVADSSYADDFKVDVNLAKTLDRDLTALLARMPAGAVNVILSHKPVFGMVKTAPFGAGNATLQFAFGGHATPGSAFAAGMPASIAFLLAGHIHQFEYLTFEDRDRYAPQLVTGTGGDRLDKTTNPDGISAGFAFQNQPFSIHNDASGTTTAMARRGFSLAEFGFAVLDQKPGGFQLTVMHADGSEAGRCTIVFKPRDIVCWR